MTPHTGEEEGTQDEALRHSFSKVATAQAEAPSPSNETLETDAESQESNSPFRSTEVKVATIEATVEFSHAGDEAGATEEETADLLRTVRRRVGRPTSMAWQRRQYRDLGIAMALAGSATLAGEIGLIELARILAARSEQTAADMLALGIWGLILLALGAILLLVGYTVPLIFWIPRDAAARREAVGSATVLVTLGSIVGAAIYLANRKLLEGEVREGGPGWNFCRYLAALWCGFLIYCATIVFGVLVWSFLRKLPLVALLVAFLSTYLPQLFFWPLVCLALLGYLLRVNSLIEIGGEAGDS